MTQAPEYRLVPVEPTEAMLEAASGHPMLAITREAYAAMLAAAPHTAAPAADRAVSELAAAFEHAKTTAIESGAWESYAKVGAAFDRLRAAIDALTRPADRADLAEAAREAVRQAISDAESLGHPLCGSMARKAARESRDEAEAAINALARSTDAPSEPTHKHLKRGTLYTEVERGWLQTSVPLTDMMELVAYRGADGKLWFRPPSEFDDDERFAVLATPPAAATPLDPIGPESLTPEALRNALKNNTLNTDQRSKLYEMLAAATSTPCASGEAHELAEEVKTAWGRNDPRRLYAALDKLGRLAAAQAPAVPATEPAVPATRPAVTIRVKLDPESGEYLSVDARSMGAVSEDTRLLDWWERNPDMVRHGLGYLGAPASWCALIDDVWATFPTLRAALTQAASTGGAAS